MDCNTFPLLSLQPLKSSAAAVIKSSRMYFGQEKAKMWRQYFHKYIYLCLTCAKNCELASTRCRICIHNFLHLSNYRMSCSFQRLTLSGHRLACVQTFWSIKALFTEKPISNSCRMISAVSFRVTHSFWSTQTDFERNLTHTTKPTASSKWLESILGRGGFIATKAFFL